MKTQTADVAQTQDTNGFRLNVTGCQNMFTV
jgi:hypothetical protein